MKKLRIIFLDIDGVLQPNWSQKRFGHDLEALRENLAERFGAEYREMNPYDLGAVVHDWHTGALARLRASFRSSSRAFDLRDVRAVAPRGGASARQRAQ